MEDRLFRHVIQPAESLRQPGELLRQPGKPLRQPDRIIIINSYAYQLKIAVYCDESHYYYDLFVY